MGLKSMGVSRSMLCYYLSGARPVPKTVWLACVGWQTASTDKRFALAA